MSQKTDIQDIAKDTIQSVTGTPPDQLRGLTVQAFNDFVSARSAIPITGNTQSAPTITSDTVTFPAAAVPTNEQPLTPYSNQGTGGNTFTARTVLVVSGTPTIATQDFLTP